MAKVTGAAAYTQLRPPEDGLSRSMLNRAGQDNARYENAAYRINQRQKDKQARDDAFIAEFAASNSALKPFDTKVKSINEYVARAIEKGKEKLPELYKVYSDPKSTMQQKIDAKMGINEIEKLPDYLKEMTTGITKYVTTQEEGLADGTLLPTESYANLNQLFDFTDDGADADIFLDKGYQPVLGYRGVDGELHKLSFQDYLNQDLPGNKKYVPINDLMKNTSEMLNTETRKTDKGLWSTTKTDPNAWSQNFVNTSAEKMFRLDENNKPTPELYSALWDAGVRGPELQNPSEQTIATVRDYYKNGSLANLKTEDSTQYDQATALGYARLNKDNKSVTPQIALNANTGKPIRTPVYSASDKGVPNQNELPYGYEVTFGNGQPLTLIEGEDRKEGVQNLIVAEDGNVYGTKVVTESVYNDETGKYEDKTRIEKPAQLSDRTINNLSRNNNLVDNKGNNFNNAKELIDFTNQQYQEKAPKVDEYGVPINN